MKYVLFKEDGNLHQEIYISGIDDEENVTITSKLETALTFWSAREAYEYGGSVHADWWRAGQR